jgi:hypothetical protein
MLSLLRYQGRQCLAALRPFLVVAFLGSRVPYCRSPEVGQEWHDTVLVGKARGLRSIGRGCNNRSPTCGALYQESGPETRDAFGRRVSCSSAAPAQTSPRLTTLGFVDVAVLGANALPMTTFSMKKRIAALYTRFGSSIPFIERSCRSRPRDRPAVLRTEQCMFFPVRQLSTERGVGKTPPTVDFLNDLE